MDVGAPLDPLMVKGVDSLTILVMRVSNIVLRGRSWATTNIRLNEGIRFVMLGTNYFPIDFMPT